MIVMVKFGDREEDPIQSFQMQNSHLSIWPLDNVNQCTENLNNENNFLKCLIQQYNWFPYSCGNVVLKYMFRKTQTGR